jgi:hypothetical protein
MHFHDSIPFPHRAHSTIRSDANKLPCIASHLTITSAIEGGATNTRVSG